MNTISIKAEKVVTYTNARLLNWYKNAKLDFNVEGSANAKFNEIEKTIEIEYTENGINKKYVERYWLDESIDYTFNVWSENAE